MDLAPLASRKPLFQEPPKEITINGETYDIPTKQASAVTNALLKVWERLGKPQTPFSESGEKLMNVIIATWEDTFPIESAAWYQERRDYKNEELSIGQQIRHETGRSLASYPFYIFQVMKIMFPNLKLSDRETNLKMVKKYPIFQMANKA